MAASGRVSIADLTDRLGVTSVTIREDLKRLELRGLLTRTRGGALARSESGAEIALEQTRRTNTSAKRAIAAAAAARIESGQTVIIDVGSTTTALAEALSPNLHDVVVVTNGLNIALSLEERPGVSVIVTGGTLRPLQHSLVAPMGSILLDKLKADIAFLGCNGVDVERGVTNANIAEAEIKQAMLRSADFAVALADRDKIGRVASAFVAELDSFDLLVTDDGAHATEVEKLSRAGLAVEVAGPVD